MEWWLAVSGAIAWHQGDGSGFSFSRADLLEMSATELIHYAEESVRRRNEERNAIRDQQNATRHR
jgi:hypothetical protein